MFLLILFLVCLFVAVGAGFMASLSDMRGLIIPNSYSLIVVVSFFVVFTLLSLGHQEGVFHGLRSHLMAGFLIFGVTAFLFALGIVGAADSKLASAYSFWMGMQGLIFFLFYMTVIGGVLGVIALVLQKKKPIKDPKPGGWVAHVQAGESKVPYGIAIAGGALVSFVKLGYFDMDVLRSFLLS